MIGDYEMPGNTMNIAGKVQILHPQFEASPLWLGQENLEGKTILLHSEQGLGDSIQFCRYIKKFKNKGCTTLLK